MAKKPKPHRPRQNRKGATIELNWRELALLQELVDKKVYGKTPNEVARYLIRRQFDDLFRSGILLHPDNVLIGSDEIEIIGT